MLDLFLNEAKLTPKLIKDFTKDAFSMKASNSSAIKLNYNNLILFLLRFSGLDLNNFNDLKDLVNIDNCTSMSFIEEVISKAKIKKENFKTLKLYSIFDSIAEELYNK